MQATACRSLSFPSPILRLRRSPSIGSGSWRSCAAGFASVGTAGARRRRTSTGFDGSSDSTIAVTQRTWESPRFVSACRRSPCRTASRHRHLPRRVVRARHQPAVRVEVAHGRKPRDRVDLQHQRDALSFPTPGIHTRRCTSGVGNSRALMHRGRRRCHSVFAPSRATARVSL